MRGVGVSGAVTLVLLLACSACGAESASDVRGQVGVAPFAANVGAGAELPDVAALLATKLASLDVGGVVPPTATGLGARAPSAVERAELQTRTGARTLVIGTATRVGVALSLDARLIDLATGGEIGLPLVEQASGEADVGRAVDALAARIATRLQEPPPAARAPAAAKPAKKKRAPGEPREPVEIQADQLDAETVEGGRRISFVGGVNAVQGDLSLHCDHLEAFYPTGSSEPDRLIAKGNIKVVQGDRSASCEEAVFYRSEDRVVCTGKPAELTEKCNRAEAEKITFFLESEKLEMVRGKILGRECPEEATP